MMTSSTVLSFIFAALLGSSVVAIDSPHSYLRENSTSAVRKNDNDIVDGGLRDLRKEREHEFDSSFVARYHNMGLEHVMNHNKEALYSFPVMTETILTFLEKDEGFPEFDKDEAAAVLDETFIVSRDGTVDAEASLNRALEESAVLSPVFGAIIDVVAKIKSEEISSVDEMIRIVQTAAEKSGESTDLKIAEAFGAVAKASDEFWTEYSDTELAVEAGDGNRRALRRCRWWQKILIIAADAIGAALGALYGASLGGPLAWLLAIIFGAIFAIAFSLSLQSNFGCDWL